MSFTHCDICGRHWAGHLTVCAPKPVSELPASSGSGATRRLVEALEGLIQECEYSASSGLPFNALGSTWTQLAKAKAVLAEMR